MVDTGDLLIAGGLVGGALVVSGRASASPQMPRLPSINVPTGGQTPSIDLSGLLGGFQPPGAPQAPDIGPIADVFTELAGNIGDGGVADQVQEATQEATENARDVLDFTGAGPFPADLPGDLDVTDFPESPGLPGIPDLPNRINDTVEQATEGVTPDLPTVPDDPLRGGGGEPGDRSFPVPLLGDLRRIGDPSGPGVIGVAAESGAAVGGAGGTFADRLAEATDFTTVNVAQDALGNLPDPTAGLQRDIERSGQAGPVDFSGIVDPTANLLQSGGNVGTDIAQTADTAARASELTPEGGFDLRPLPEPEQLPGDGTITRGRGFTF